MTSSDASSKPFPSTSPTATHRFAILGNSGSGKSTLAERLARQHGIPVLDLDTVAWEPGEIAVARDLDSARVDVRRFCERSGGWVVEGCYAGLIEAALVFRPELLFLDPGLEACLAHCRERPWEPHKYPSKSEQDARLPFLLEWVADYYRREGDLSWRRHRELFEAYTGPKRWLRAATSGGNPDAEPETFSPTGE